MSEYTNFTDALPPAGAVVLVRSKTNTWQGERELHFVADFFGPGNPRLLEPRTGHHLWYPERMEWRMAPVQPTRPADDDYFSDGPATAVEPENTDV